MKCKIWIPILIITLIVGAAGTAFAIVISNNHDGNIATTVEESNIPGSEPGILLLL